MTAPAFILFGPAHLAALLLLLAAPLVLVVLARRWPGLDAPIRFALAALLAGGWLSWYALFWQRGWLTLNNALPLNLCDWAAVALIAALTMERGQEKCEAVFRPAARPKISPRRRIYELGYFWGLGGTVQGLVTPDIARDFPDPQFLLFFLNHGGIIASLLYLTLGRGLRPVPRSLSRVVLATFAYVAVAGMADVLLGTNYAFLRAKPGNPSLLDFLSPWPWYIPELVLIGLASVLIYYAPFALKDRVRRTPP